jgi:DNA-binding NtrC family response regulator
MQWLLSYEWPGNVRELENMVQHMVAINSGPVLTPADAPTALRNFSGRRHAERMPVSPEQRAAGSTPEPFVVPVLPLAEMEKRAIINALQYTKGDRVMTANLLGIGRTTLYRKIKEYGIRL